VARVLVVEDEPNIAEIILFKLRREGHLVTRVETAAEARGAGPDWDVVLLDSSLPGEDSLLLLRELCGLVPVAFLTESLDDVTPGLAQEIGAAATVRKPFKPTLLARLVAELAPKRDAGHSDDARPGELIAPMGGLE
jgi:DNA-binding response OmpR family regulator